MISKRLLCLVGIAVLTAPTAHALELEPGLWDVVEESSGGMMGDRREEKQECIGEEPWTPERMMDGQETCKVTDVHDDDTSMSWKISCAMPVGTMTGGGKMKSTGKTMSGEMNMSIEMMGRKIEMKESWTGTWNRKNCKPS